MQHSNLQIFACCAISSLSLLADVTWSVSDGVGTASGSGDLVFEEVQSLSELDIVSENGDIAISGEGVTFTSDPAQVLSYGTNSIGVALTAPGSIDFGKKILDKKTFDGYITTSYQTLFTDMDLSKYSPLEALTGGGSTIAVGLGYTVMYIVRGEGTLTAQFQIIQGGWTKCVKVEFVQSGSDVQARAVYAKYATTSSFGMDFDTGGNSQSVATQAGAGGYGVSSVTLAYVSDSKVTASGRISATAVGITNSVDFTAVGEGVLAEVGGTMPPLGLNGSLTVTNAHGFAFDTVSGNGTIRLGGLSGTERNSKSEVTYSVQATSAWTVFATNAYLRGMTNVYAYSFVGGAISSEPAPGWIHYFTNNGYFATGQFHTYDSKWEKCVFLEFRQASTNIEVRARNACYYSLVHGHNLDVLTIPWGRATEQDLRRESAQVADTATKGYYSIGSFTAYFDTEKECDLSPSVFYSLQGDVSMDMARFYQSGGIVCITNRLALPNSTTNSVYEVTDGGTLQIDAPGCTMYTAGGVGKGKTTLRATNGGRIVQNKDFNFDNHSQRLQIDGGILELQNSPENDNLGFNSDCESYVNFVSLANGARVIGGTARLLQCNDQISPYGGDSYWKISGSSPSVAENGFMVAGAEGQACIFDVEDVTGDDEVDFDVWGYYRTYDTSNFTNNVLRKTGEGTMAFCRPIRIYKPIEIDAGTVCLKTTGVIGGDYLKVPVQLGSGSLELYESTTNALSTLAVTNDASIVLHEGAALTIEDSSAVEWTSGKKLNITGDVDNKSVRFGTSASALTAEQQSALRINGYCAVLNELGYVVLAPPGTMVIFK